MRRHHFFKLSRAIQDRFIAALRGQTLPQPILNRSVSFPVPWGWVLGCVGSVAVLLLSLRWGYGDTHSAVAIAPAWLLALYSVLLAAAGYSATRAAALWWEARRVPFDRGIYVFPVGVVDARRYEIEVHPVAELRDVERTGRSVVLHFEEGRSFAFTTEASAGAQAQQSILKFKSELSDIQRADPERELKSMDPLAEPRYSNPLAPESPRVVPVPSWARVAPYVVAISALLMGLFVGLVRNNLSERSMYVAARRADTVEAYQAYLANGGRRPDVRATLLPTAEVEELKRRRSLPELEAYAGAHPDSFLLPNVQDAQRELLREQLAQAVVANTLTALDEFESAHPSAHLVADDLRAARRALMKRFQERFVAEHASAEKDLPRFFDELLTHLAESGPKVEVRFVRIVPDSVERADRIARKDKYFADVMLPSRYFDAQRSAPREQKLFEALAQRFEGAFPADVLRLSHGEPVEGKNEIPENVERPTLFVSHSTELGGGIRNVNPHGTFFGVGFLFKARFVVPGGQNPLEMQFNIWKPPDLLKLRKGRITISQIYNTMANDAYGAYEPRLVRWLFRD